MKRESLDEATPKAGPVGRFARLIMGIVLTAITVPVYFLATTGYIIRSVALTVGLLLFYVVLHAVIQRAWVGLDPWFGAVLAVAPVISVWWLGQGGGPLFGHGEGGTAALTYLSISFLVDFVRADAGCEVMALPGLLFRRRTHLHCVLLCSVDHLEQVARPGADQ